MWALGLSRKDASIAAAKHRDALAAHREVATFSRRDLRQSADDHFVVHIR
jgi:hypothetical protein